MQGEFPGQLIHVPVWINKRVGLSRESTQRTRSFLFAALGTVVAEPIQAGGVRFFENGTVSLNFPIAEEVIRARASRTTHPVALHLLQSLCRAVTGREFAVDNPYLFKTKKDVVATLTDNQAAHMVSLTCSCAHLMFKSKSQRHCGSCSQCIDRRFAILAAGLQQYDPDADYEADVFVGPRKEGAEKSMAMDYVRHGIELSRLSEAEIAARFNAELSRAVRYEPKRSEAAEKIIAMHKRHGEVVTRVLEKQIQGQAEKLVKGTLDASSLLMLFLGMRHRGLQDHAAATKAEELFGAEKGQNGMSVVTEMFKLILAKIGVPEQRRPPKKRKLLKRDAVIFAAILLGLKGLKYSSFLQEYGVRPKWSDSDSSPESYPKSYRAGEPWRKRIQDEKARARARMNRYTDAELADAFSSHLPDRIDELRRQLATREAPSARAKLPFD